MTDKDEEEIKTKISGTLLDFSPNSQYIIDHFLIREGLQAF